MKSDANKGISLIEYNTYLNKVKQVTWSDGRCLKFFYDGGGSLIKKENSAGEYWNYVGDLIYKNGNFYSINIPEGRTVFENNLWNYEFDYRDIWGNLRVSFSAENGQLTLKQKSDYDALGYTFNQSSGVNKNYFQYQKQQRIEDFDLNIYFFKFRPSDPTTGRFWMVDPLASQYPHNSTYALQENKFGMGVELEGAELENFNSQFKNPNELKEKTPDPAKSQIQVYSTSVANSKKSFSEVKNEFMKNPEKLLSNSKAEFHAPENEKGEQTGLVKGNTIEIEIAGPQNDSYVKVHNVNSEDNSVSATFVTLEGHVERGVINFSIKNNGNNGMTFTIGSMSQLDIGVANSISKLGDFSRKTQKESWKEVLNNFNKITGGTETKRIIK